MHSKIEKENLNDNLLCLSAISDRKFYDLSDYEKVVRTLGMNIKLFILLKKAQDKVDMSKFEGIIESKNLSLDEALRYIVSKEGAYSPPILKGERSPYYDKFKMGARLAPRPFWFIDFVAHPILRINPKVPNIKTTEKSRKQAKGNWRLESCSASYVYLDSRSYLRVLIFQQPYACCLSACSLFPGCFTRNRAVFIIPAGQANGNPFAPRMWG